MNLLETEGTYLNFCLSRKPFVAADLGYEAGECATEFIGAKAIRVLLSKTYAHDLKKIAAASADTGLF